MTTAALGRPHPSGIRVPGRSFFALSPAGQAEGRRSALRRPAGAGMTALGMLWLLDAGLQYQPFMFGRGLAEKVIAPTGDGSPAWVSQPVAWTAAHIAAHPAVANSVFATGQLLLAIGLLSRRAPRTALALAAGWSVLLWWLGEGLGQTLAGPVSPLSGAPGAAVLYALAAVLLWPRRHRSGEPGGGWSSTAERSLLGRRGAVAVWAALWVALAAEALRPALRAPGAVAGLIAANADGEPGWLARIDSDAARVLAHRGTPASFSLAALCLLAAAAALIPARHASARRGLLAITVALAAVIWVVGENLGGIATGSGTDPNTGPVLMLLAALFWPRRTPATRPSS